jgi:SAM-dependent methyltransferase
MAHTDKKASPNYDAALLDPVARTFTRGLAVFGAHHKALAWHDADRMQRRFQIFRGLLADIPEDRPITVNDHGCGYGAMFEAFRDLPALKTGRYYGTDISREMVEEARRRIADPRAVFEMSHVATHDADYSFVSGTWNMKMWADDVEWRGFVLGNLKDLWSRTRVALGFNMLSVKNPWREPTLYYADPEDIVNFCRRELTPNVRTVDRLEPREFVVFLLR